ncbi:hypothetical protein DM819_04315 [Pseudomonas hunanensis]|uniref:HTH araC/xylS-type domain-containing protein n=1 Tax=Pseudomonas hunanensis TaxID=1247546 RepID=A0ABD6MU99_9PSED|nr:hypothetical protein [Pseudomonas hunanensis]
MGVQMPGVLERSEGASAFEALRSNPNAELKWRLDDAQGRPAAAMWHANDLELSEAALEEVRLTYHIAGSTRVDSIHQGRRACAGVKARSLAITGPGSYEWRLHGTLDFAQLYLWPDSSGEEESTLAIKPMPAYFRNALGAKDPWIEGLFLMLLSYPLEEGHRRAELLRGMHEKIVEHLHLRYSTLDRPSGVSRLTVQGGLSSEVLRRVQQEMAEHLSDPLRVSDLARLCGCSESHFYRAFKESAGRSPYQYLLDLRVQVARDQLAKSDVPISEIGRNVGFPNAAKFSAAFADRQGVTPSAYRRLNSISS